MSFENLSKYSSKRKSHKEMNKINQELKVNDLEIVNRNRRSTIKVGDLGLEHKKRMSERKMKRL